MYDYKPLMNIAEVEYADIVDFAEEVGRKLRINLKEGTYIDVFYSVRSKVQRYSYHWERSEKDGRIYREDNIPNGSWEHILGFPKHFHSGEYENVLESRLSEEPKRAVREFLNFVRKVIEEERSNE